MTVAKPPPPCTLKERGIIVFSVISDPAPTSWLSHGNDQKNLRYLDIVSRVVGCWLWVPWVFGRERYQEANKANIDRSNWTDWIALTKARTTECRYLILHTLGQYGSELESMYTILETFSCRYRCSLGWEFGLGSSCRSWEMGYDNYCKMYTNLGE